jgi:hypothetical protein
VKSYDARLVLNAELPLHLMLSLCLQHFPPIFCPFLARDMAAQRCVNLYPSARPSFGIAIVGSATAAGDARPPSNHRDFWRDTDSRQIHKTLFLQHPHVSRLAPLALVPTRRMCASRCPGIERVKAHRHCLMKSWAIARPSFIFCIVATKRETQVKGRPRRNRSW